MDSAGIAILRNRIQALPLTLDCPRIGGAVIRYNPGLPLRQLLHQQDNIADGGARTACAVSCLVHIK
jgi:hypothetical protein